MKKERSPSKQLALKLGQVGLGIALAVGGVKAMLPTMNAEAELIGKAAAARQNFDGLRSTIFSDGSITDLEALQYIHANESITIEEALLRNHRDTRDHVVQVTGGITVSLLGLAVAILGVTGLPTLKGENQR